MSSRARARRVLLAFVVAVTSIVGVSLFPREAHAIIGRPLTPLSYAGVARRTVRRSAVVAPVVAAPVVAAPVVVRRPAVVW